jgi:hypothetical protein
VSNEFKGNRDTAGDVRPRIAHTLTFDKAIKENADSRIWLGVRWRVDADGLPGTFHLESDGGYPSTPKKLGAWPKMPASWSGLRKILELSCSS